MPENQTASLLEEFARLIEALEAAGVNYALAGGLAVGFHANPRFTEDIDLALVPSALDPLRQTLRSMGYVELAEPMRLGKGSLDIARLVRFAAGREPIVVDVLVPHEQTLATAAQDRVRRQFLGRDLWVLSREALITFKKLRGSKQDLADIEALEASADDEA